MSDCFSDVLSMRSELVISRDTQLRTYRAYSLVGYDKPVEISVAQKGHSVGRDSLTQREAGIPAVEYIETCYKSNVVAGVVD